MGARCVESFSPGCCPHLHCEDLSVHTHTGGAAITYRKSPQKTSLRAAFQWTAIRSHNCAKGFLESLSGCFCCGWWHFITARIIFHSLSFCDLNTQRQIDVGSWETCFSFEGLTHFFFFFFRFGISYMRHKQINKWKCIVIAAQFKTNNEAAFFDEKIMSTRGAHMPQIQHGSNYAVT